MIVWNSSKFLLHSHLSGMIRPQTVFEIIQRTKGFEIAPNLEAVHKKMVCSVADERNFDVFFNKFKIFDRLTWHDWAIDMAICQICRDLEIEKIEYAEISFSIDKYLRHLGWTPKEVVKFICRSCDMHSRRFGVKVGLLLSLRYDSPKKSQIAFSDLIEDPEVEELLAGIDLVGDEKYFDAEFYKPIFDKWRQRGKILRCHVGEINGGGCHVAAAIKDLKVSRIAHGIQATDEDMKLANDCGVYFDVAIHSNLYTGVVSDVKKHPLKRMIENGCKVTLNTDDPVMCACTLDGEFHVAVKNGLIGLEDIDSIQRNAVEAAAFGHKL